MVVLAASICTRGGKAVLSRQFRAMSKSQVEVLLSSFPRYIDSGTQHTTVESDTVRYVYQPLEELYMVLITTKNSNILQDIETLHLFAQVVSSICRSNLSEQEIGRNAFELLSAFDEIVCLGYRENLTLLQVRSILEMESHEEKIQEIIARNKEQEASEERKRKARQLEMQRREMAKLGPRQSNSRGLGSNFGSQYQSLRTSSPDIAATTHYDNYKADTAKSAPSTLKAKGMSLGKKANTRLYDALSDEIAATTEEIARPTPNTPVENPPASLVPLSEGINISFTETTTARCNRDGGMDSLDVQGQLNLHISDSSLSRIQIGLDINDADGTQYKTHPNVDRNLFKDKATIGLRDSSRPFPLNQQMSVLRWRLQGKSDSESATLPISVNNWPSPVGDGTTDVNIEYELDSHSANLHDVVIIIPLPVPGAVPHIREIDGDYQITPEGLSWTPSIADIENGRLEFNVAGDDSEGFFPVEVRYNTSKTFSSVDIKDIKLVDMMQDVQYEKVIRAETVIHIS